ncbi:MAG: SDR family NAD(P)-dependent oxidoreductase [Gammaproteobacteria bacterium]
MSRSATEAHKKKHPHCMIIGAGPGISHAVALEFAHAGYNISLLARRPQRLGPMCDEIHKKTGRHGRAHAADAASERALIEGIDAARGDLGDVDVLIYNVATHEPGRPMAVSSERLVDDFRINVVGALLSARAVAPAMIARKRGTILFTGGGFAYDPSPDYASLSMDKAALRSLTYTLAQELGAHGVHVATVTVHGFVQHGTKFDPSRIARAYIALHEQPKGHFDIETVYK